MSDTLQRFLFEEAAIRGELVHLDASWREMLALHDYPQPVRNLLGEMVAAATLLSATLKFDGTLTIQVQGNGPVNFMVVEATSRRTVRGLAHWNGEVPESGLADQLGEGHLVITITPDEGERYQGVVEIRGETLAEAIDGYLERSEQLATRMWLTTTGESVAGLLLQRLPNAGGAEDDEAWHRITLLGGTITDGELLGLSQQEVVHRLFHEETLRLFDSEPVSFRCSCSQERVAGALRGLGREELEAILAEQGEIAINCEFCNRHYRFDAVDVEQLLSDTPVVDPGTTQH